MTAATRALCPHCERPLRTCLCRWVSPTDNQTEVLILQHPLEVRQAKGSAKLLQQSLARCRLHIGETFAPAELQGWLTQGQATGVRSVLLYPDTPCAPGAAPPHADPVDMAPAHTRLVVLDGTWRKSLKMLHLNPALQTLPRLALRPEAPSRYLVRKAHRPEQRSTLEATCLALAHIEHNTARYGPLLRAFEHFVTACAPGPETSPH